MMSSSGYSLEYQGVCSNQPGITSTPSNYTTDIKNRSMTLPSTDTVLSMSTECLNRSNSTEQSTMSDYTVMNNFMPSSTSYTCSIDRLSMGYCVQGASSPIDASSQSTCNIYDCIFHPDTECKVSDYIQTPCVSDLPTAGSPSTVDRPPTPEYDCLSMDSHLDCAGALSSTDLACSIPDYPSECSASCSPTSGYIPYQVPPNSTGANTSDSEPAALELDDCLSTTSDYVTEYQSGVQSITDIRDQSTLYLQPGPMPTHSVGYITATSN